MCWLVVVVMEVKCGLRKWSQKVVEIISVKFISKSESHDFGSYFYYDLSFLFIILQHRLPPHLVTTRRRQLLQSNHHQITTSMTTRAAREEGKKEGCSRGARESRHVSSRAGYVSFSFSFLLLLKIYCIRPYTILAPNNYNNSKLETCVSNACKPFFLHFKALLMFFTYL